MRLRNLLRLSLFILLAAVSSFATNLSAEQKALALSGNDFNAGRIIDDAIFFNSNTMSPQDIQTFLNAKLPTCDTNGDQAYAGTTRRAYSISKGYNPPYTCLKDYSQTIAGKDPDTYCGGTVTAGTKTAAQIIYDVAQACGVNPKVLIVLLQKEQNLVTDDWPWPIQYTSATGYGCPDTASCDTTYAGFFNQIYYAARQYQRYVKQSSLFNFVGGQSRNIQYNPNTACGSSSVFIQNQATAGLYNYTPYQPNQAALNNLYGTGDSCSAYGNRNFWRLYVDWFGSPLTTTPYAWSYESQQAYSDSARTQLFTGTPTVLPNGKIYATLKARNMGTQTWNQATLHLGTSKPNDRTSVFSDPSWISSTRPTGLQETSVAPGQIGTFKFTLQAPSSSGTYNEYFNLLAEGQTWLNDLGLFYAINVNTAATPSSAGPLTSGGSIAKDSSMVSSDSESTLTLQRDGNLVLYSNFAPVWSTGAFGASASRLIMQGDGNLVLYDRDNHALWNSETGGNPGAQLVLQTDGNMVIYSASRAALWATYTIQNPDHLSYINTTLPVGRLYPGQSIDTADRRFHLILQGDGNLVLYSPTRALWASSTDGKSVAFLAMQGDGNLVLYDKNAQPLWSSQTGDSKRPHLVIQQDGNLVLYNSLNNPSWNTETSGAH